MAEFGGLRLRWPSGLQLISRWWSSRQASFRIGLRASVPGRRQRSETEQTMECRCRLQSASISQLNLFFKLTLLYCWEENVPKLRRGGDAVRGAMETLLPGITGSGARHLSSPSALRSQHLLPAFLLGFCEMMCTPRSIRQIIGAEQ